MSARSRASSPEIRADLGRAPARAAGRQGYLLGVPGSSLGRMSGPFLAPFLAGLPLAFEASCALRAGFVMLRSMSSTGANAARKAGLLRDSALVRSSARL